MILVAILYIWAINQEFRDSKKESTIEDFVQTSDNPFDFGNVNKMDGLRQSYSISKKKNNIYKKKRDQINSIKDDDLRRELEDGQTQLISYSEDR
jgi:hypothetical protein